MDGYSVRSDGRRIEIAREGWEEALGTLRGPCAGLGRGRPARVTLPTGEPAIRKRYFRGGFVRFLRDRYLSWRRLVREIGVSERLRARGVGAPVVIAAVAERSGPWYRLDLLSLEIPSAIRFADLLRAPSHARSIGQVAAAVRRLHDAGVVHGDLTVENILLADRVYFVDFDAARIAEPVPPRARRRELERLLRSARKRRLPVSRADVVRFERAYEAPADVEIMTPAW